jgi:hypothetical protein
MSRPTKTPTWRGLSAPKRGHTAGEYEDAFAGGAGRFAVADGASETSFAGLWARLLVEGFVSGPEAAGDWLTASRGSWAAEVGRVPLPWYAEAKRDEGAFATFLGLLLEPDGWRAWAVGDSCLFQVREDRLVEAFPIGRSDEFSNHPRLLGSCGAPPTTAAPVERQGTWEVGDRFLLATDALAQWFLGQCEQGERPWRRLTQLGPGAFPIWVEEQRERGELRNDDVTLLVVEV